MQREQTAEHALRFGGRRRQLGAEQEWRQVGVIGFVIRGVVRGGCGDHVYILILCAAGLIAVRSATRAHALGLTQP